MDKSKKSNQDHSQENASSFNILDNNAMLQVHNAALADEVKRLEEELFLKDEIIKKLQGAIGSDESSIILPSNEEIICDVQIGLLKKISSDRMLTLDETRQFEILNKAKRLISGKATDIEASYTKIDTNNVAALIETARKKIK